MIRTGLFRSLKLAEKNVRGKVPKSTFTLLQLKFSTAPQQPPTCDDTTSPLDDAINIFYSPPSFAVHDNKLAENIRCCTKRRSGEDFASITRTNDTGMSICFLGTSAGHPSQFRSPSATLLRLGGKSFLFDAGEGIQRQLSFTTAKPSHIEKIFITHLHGDHIFGLPGFLLSLQHSLKEEVEAETSKKKGRKPPKSHIVEIYGPPGIFNYIVANMTLSCTSFQFMSIEVIELVGGRVRRVQGGKGVPNPFEAHYQEFDQRFVRRKTIMCDNGVWTINDFKARSREDILTKTNRNNMNSTRVKIKAAEVNHLPGIATFGFVIEEEEPPRNVDAIKAGKLGVPPGKKLELLKYGYSVWTEDGSGEVKPEEVWTQRKRQARKIAIIGDNRGWTSEMEDIAKNADILVHEATLAEENPDWGHSTATMAGAMAKKINAAVLILNHISSKFDKNKGAGLADLAGDARKSSDDKSLVAVAYDFMEILVPWLGFRPVTENEPSIVRSENASAKNKPVESVKEWFGIDRDSK